MDDFTQQHTPENDTGPLQPEDETNNSTIKGADEIEYTQMGTSKDEQRRYAIPDADPLDLTVAGLPQFKPSAAPGTQPAKVAENLPRILQTENTVPTASLATPSVPAP